MTSAAPAAATALIGPGRLVLVVGPSGAGKDTVLTGVKAACAADASVRFPRRVVTRASDGHEEHDSVDAAQFARARADGAFALSWDAHDLSYGIPRDIDDDIRAGRTVICNVSRGVVADARTHYADVISVLVTAPAEVLATRLAGRARATDTSLGDRLARSDRYAGFAADVVIVNDGAVADAVGSFLDFLKTTRHD